ncbi:hypothetical protein [Desulfovibrio falkowii]|uniref:hypothetical protein n=1 Tax=Desulfovibrio sp. WGS1351 TaxID=3366814 RepID=UPI00372D38DB
MSVFIVVYDIPADNPAGRDRLRQELESGAWAQVSESVYTVQRNGTAQAFYDFLISRIEKPVKNLYIFEINNNFFGSGAGSKADRWLDNMKAAYPSV